MRRDTCTTCGGAFKTDRDGLWSGDKREHRCESTCVKHLKERLAAAEALLREAVEAWNSPAYRFAFLNWRGNPEWYEKAQACLEGKP